MNNVIVSRVLFLALIIALVSSITGCAKPVEETDVVGTYVKDSAEPVIFRAGATEVTMAGTEGAATLQLNAGGEAKLGGSTIPWALEDGVVTIFFFNASTSGDFKGDKIVGLGGEGVVWNKK